jgi:hypothetical protein
MTVPATVENDQTGLMAEQLSAQYQKALAGLIEQIKFGAMMLALQEHLFFSTRGKGNTNNLQQGNASLSGWVKENCPEISIGTAWRWMSLAKGIQEHFQLGKTTDIAAMLSDSSALSAKHQKIGEKLRTFIAGKSATQLLFDFRIGVPDPKKRGGYRGPGEPDTRTDEEKIKEMHDACRTLMGKFFFTVDFYVEKEASWKNLSKAEIQGLHDCLLGAAETVKEHIKRLY